MADTNSSEDIELVNPEVDSPSQVDGNRIGHLLEEHHDNDETAKQINGQAEETTDTVTPAQTRLKLTEANVSIRTAPCKHGEDNEAFSDEGQEKRSPTELIPTDTVGKIRFLNTTSYDQTPSEYVRLDKDTEPKDFLEFLQKDWKLKKPSLLISVTGAATDIEFPGRDEYFRSIVQAAVSTDAWIITGGTNYGVMKYIGQAVRNHRHTTGDEVVVIGIVTWDNIKKDHQDQLQRNDPDEIQKAEEVIDKIKKQGLWLDLKEELGSLASYLKPVDLNMDGESWTTMDKTDGRSSVELEPNHTHFVLVDTGERKFGGEIKLRVQLECAISRWENVDKEKSDARIPVVYIAINGGNGTIKSTCEAVANNIPVIAVANTGRAADVMARAFSQKKSIAKSDRQLRAITKTDEATDQAVLHLKECQEKGHLLTVFDKDKPDMENAVINALNKEANGLTGENSVGALMLALKFNRIDMVVKTELSQMVLQIPSGHCEALQYALIHNRTEFIELILGFGKVNLKEYLSDNERLLHLYNSQSNNSVLVKLLQETNTMNKCENKFTLIHVDKVIKKLTGDVITFKHSMVLLDHNGSIQKLFIYAILNNFDEMADYFWSRCSEAIPAALVASKLYKSMASWKFKSAEWRETVLQNTRKYEDRAYDILTRCGENPGRCDPSDLLIRVLPQWGNITCLNIADTSEDIKFMSHCVVEKLLHQKWHGRIYSDDVMRTDSVVDVFQPLWLLICSMIPFLIPYLVRFRESKGNQRYLYWLQIWWFYASPNTIFRNSMVFYVFFIILFSYNLLWEDIYIPISQATGLDWLLMFWVASMIMEEIRQIAEWEANSFFLQMAGWWSDPWNQLDLLAVLAFIAGSILRFTTREDAEKAEEVADAARIVLAFDLFIFYIRFLEYLTFVKSIGPKVLMMGRMFIDLAFFMSILFIILLGYGVSVHVVLYPYVKEPATTVFQSIFYRPYFQIYGELFLDNIQASPNDGSCTFNTSAINQGEEPCALHPEIGVFLLAVYMLLSNVLLLNLLIAMFSNTFNSVQEQTDLHWRFQRYALTREYVEKPMLVPPLCIVSPIARFVRYFVLKEQLGGSYRYAMRCEFNENKTNMLILFEESHSRQYIKDLLSPRDTEQLSERVDRLEEMLKEEFSKLGREKHKVEESTA